MMQGKRNGEGNELKGKIAVVTSGKGGVGKTTTTAHLGAQIARRGRQAALVDADIGLRNLDVALGLEGRIVYDLVDVIEGLCGIDQALIQSDDVPGLWLLPASQSRRQDSISPGQMGDVASILSERFDWVLIDCPAGVEHGFFNAITCAQTAIVVSTPDVSSVRDARRVISLLSAAHKEDIRLIVNRYRTDLARRGASMSVDEMTALLPARILGVVPEDRDAVAAANRGRLLDPSDSAAGMAFQRIARRLMGEDIEIRYGRSATVPWWIALWRNRAS
jgi:septum site-determining protein MinD